MVCMSLDVSVFDLKGLFGGRDLLGETVALKKLDYSCWILNPMYRFLVQGPKVKMTWVSKCSHVRTIGGLPCFQVGSVDRVDEGTRMHNGGRSLHRPSIFQILLC